ncbi:TPA: phage holin family protein [Escherichia coli]
MKRHRVLPMPKPFVSWLMLQVSWCAWCLMLLYAITPLSYLCGHPLPADWLVVVLNLVFGVLVVRARGNVSKIFALLSG